MSSNPAVLAQLQAWREQGADRQDPARFNLIAALAERTQCYTGTARQQLDARLDALTAAYADIVSNQPNLPVSAAVAEAGPLQMLLQQLDAEPLQYQLGLSGSAASSTAAVPEAGDATPMPALDEFQQLWSRIRIDSLLRQCLDSLPEDAGPLHSSVLTYRAMALMQSVSPEYLQHFIAYVDVLTWMEQLGAAGSTAATESKRKASRSRRPRKTT